MKTMLHRVISLLLCMSLCLCLVPAGWAEDLEEISPNVDAGDLRFLSDSCVGDMIVSVLQREENLNVQSGVITDIVISGNKAAVEFQTDRAAKLVTAVYSEDSIQMLGSGTVDVYVGEVSAEIDIQIDVMPAYFVLTAYLLDADTLEPLCQEYTSRYYTKEFQDFLDTTTGDYNEELVLNLDGDESTNFLIFKEDTVRVAEHEDVNHLIDNGDGSYTVYNADAQVRNLSAGDKFAHTAADGMVVTAIVQNINVGGTTVTLTEDATALPEDFFDFIKIEGSSAESESDVDPNTMDLGVVLYGVNNKAFQSFAPADESELFYDNMDKMLDAPAPDVEVSIDRGSGVLRFSTAKEQRLGATLTGGKVFHFTVFKPAKGIEINIEVGISANLKYYKDQDWKYTSFALDYSAEINGSVGGKDDETENNGSVGGRNEIVRTHLGDLPFNLGASGLKLVVPVDLILETEVKAKLSGVLKGTIGFSDSSDTGLVNLTSRPVWKSEKEIAGKVFVGLSLKPEVVDVLGLSRTLLRIYIEAKPGILLEGKWKGRRWEDENMEIGHFCYDCIKGSVSIDCEINLFLRAFGKGERRYELARFNGKIADFYYSVDYNEFGWGTCPHIAYLTEITVADIDQYYRPVSGIKVYITNPTTGFNDAVVTDKLGNASILLPNGQYTVRVDYTFGGYELKSEKCITVKDEKKELTLFVARGNEDDVAGSGGVFCSGTDGNIHWSYSGGTLVISGHGSIPDGNWASYWASNCRIPEPIKHVIIRPGITGIGSYAFDGQDIESVTFSNTVKRIGRSAFNSCHLRSVVIPGSVERIEAFAFYSNEWIVSGNEEEGEVWDGLSSVTILGSTEDTGYNTGYIYMDSDAFHGNGHLTTLVVLKRWNGEGFNYCPSIKNVYCREDIEETTYLEAKYNGAEIHLLGNGNSPKRADVSILSENSPTADTEAFFASLTGNLPGGEESALPPEEQHQARKETAYMEYPLATFEDPSDHIGNITIALLEANHRDNRDAVLTSNTADVWIDPDQEEVCFSGLIPDGRYAVLIVRDAESEALLSADNLLYIAQCVANEYGNFTLSYLPREQSNGETALACGVVSLCDARFGVKQYETGYVEVSVLYDGQELEAETDYIYSVSREDDVITVTVHGRGDYSGTVVLEATPPHALYTVHENYVAATATVPAHYDEVIKCLICGREFSRKTLTPDIILRSVRVVVNDGICIRAELSIADTVTDWKHVFVDLIPFSIGDEYPLNTGIKTGDNYYYEWPLEVTNLAETVFLCVKDEDDNLYTLLGPDGTDYTATGYRFKPTELLEAQAKDTGQTQALRDLAASLLDYSAAARVYYSKTEADVSTAVSELDSAALDPWRITTSGYRPKGCEGADVMLYCGIKNTLRIFFHTDGTKPINSYTCQIDGKNVSLSQELYYDSYRWGYLQISDIAARELDTVHTFSISDGTDTFTVNCSALGYCRSAARSDNTVLANLGKALFLYNRAADAAA